MLHLPLAVCNAHKTCHQVLDLRICQRPILPGNHASIGSEGDFEIGAEDGLRSGQVGFLGFTRREGIATRSPVEKIANFDTLNMKNRGCERTEQVKAWPCS